MVRLFSSLSYRDGELTRVTENYWMFHREDMHATMRESAFGEKGAGPPAKLLTNYRVRRIDAEAGKITFDDGSEVTADLIIGGDGIRSVVRSEIGITAKITPAALACYRCNVTLDTIKAKGLKHFGREGGIDYWCVCASFLQLLVRLSRAQGRLPGARWSFAILQDRLRRMSRWRDHVFLLLHAPGQVAFASGGCMFSLSYLRWLELMPAQFRMEEVAVEEIINPYLEVGLDNDVIELLRNSVDRMPWRLYNHEPYPYWHKGKVCLLGDAAHPMCVFPPSLRLKAELDVHTGCRTRARAPYKRSRTPLRLVSSCRPSTATPTMSSPASRSTRPFATLERRGYSAFGSFQCSVSIALLTGRAQGRLLPCD